MDKQEIFDACQSLLSSKIAIARQGMQDAQASANAETKSSAGDKYETGRAMSQRERDLHARQLSELQHMQQILGSINPEHVQQCVSLGALVETSQGTYFIAVSLGMIKIKDYQVMAISAISPIAQAMLDKKAGDQFTWMNRQIQVSSIS